MLGSELRQSTAACVPVAIASDPESGRIPPPVARPSGFAACAASTTAACIVLKPTAMQVIALRPLL
jgi:hypothetical protein